MTGPTATTSVAKLSEAGRFDCVIDMICYEPEDAQCDIELFRGRTQQFIFCSTVDVYTKTPAAYPVTEENGVLGALPSFPYAYKKMLCEQALWEAHRRGDFALTVCRPTFTYNEAWSPGIHSFGGQSYHLDRLRRGKPIILHGDGTSIWVASYRDDTAERLSRRGRQPEGLRPGLQSRRRRVDDAQPHLAHHRARDGRARARLCLYSHRPSGPAGAQTGGVVPGEFPPQQPLRQLQGQAGPGLPLHGDASSRGCGSASTSVTAQPDRGLGQSPFYDRIVEAWRRTQSALVEEFRANPV